MRLIDGVRNGSFPPDITPEELRTWVGLNTGEWIEKYAEWLDKKKLYIDIDPARRYVERHELLQQPVEVDPNSDRFKELLEQIRDPRTNQAHIIWVYTEDGKLDALPRRVEFIEGGETLLGWFCHTQAARWKPVYAAGEALYTLNSSTGEWEITSINRMTGHYIVSEESLLVGIQEFRRRGFVIPGKVIDLESIR